VVPDIEISYRAGLHRLKLASALSESTAYETHQNFGQGDFWLLTSQITYGDVDLTVPVPVQVKWAGNTPVITDEKIWIPGLGTFSARVLLDGDPRQR
jgi:hypothetical protein